MVVEDGGTFRDEIHFVQFLTVGDNGLAGLVDPAVHAHDQLVLESCVCVQEKVVEMDLEGLEQGLRNLVLD